MKLVLDESQVNELVNKPIVGSGGFQSLLRRLKNRTAVYAVTEVTQKEIDQLRQYATHGKGGFQDRARRILGD